MNKYRQGVAAFILNSRGEVLLVQLVGYKDNEWTVPGGGIEEGETAKEAVWREVNEEVGLTKEDLVLERESKIINTYIFGKDAKNINPNFAGQQKSQFVFKLISNKPIVLQPEELAVYKWVSKEEIHKYLVFPGQADNAAKVLAP